MEDAAKAHDGSCFFCAAAWKGISETLRLSKREIEISQCVMLGDTERQAAAFLKVSPRTVRTHLERIRAKLGVDTRTELIVWLCEAHLDWLSRSSGPSGCRLKNRLVQL